MTNSPGKRASSVPPTSDMALFLKLPSGSLRESNRHQVWKEDDFKVSRAADQIVGQQADEAYSSTTLPYGEGVRTLQIDMIAFDSADGTSGLTRSSVAMARLTPAKYVRFAAT